MARLEALFAFLAAIAVVLLLLWNGCQLPSEEQWHGIKIVDATGDVGMYTSLAVDGSNVNISYFDQTNGDLKFAKSTDGGKSWPAENIKTVDATDGVGEYTSLAVDGSDVYISYLDGTNFNLKFAKSTDGGKSWPAGNIKTVDEIGNVGFFTSIAVDGDNIYISYWDSTNSDLKFAKSTDGGATWSAGNIKIVDATGNVGMYTSLAVDGSNIYISYRDSTNNDLKFAKSIDGGATWPVGNIKIVDATGNVGMHTSLVVVEGNIYISYFDQTNGDLKCAKSTDEGANWLAGNIKTVDATDNVGQYTSLAVDTSNVCISYCNGTNGDLKFAKSTDGSQTWLSENIKTVDATDIVGIDTSLAVVGGNIYISYYDQTNTNLKFAKSTDGGQNW